MDGIVLINNNRNLVCLFFLSRLAGNEGRVISLPKKLPFSGQCHCDQFKKHRLILTAGKLVLSYRKATEQLRLALESLSLYPFRKGMLQSTLPPEPQHRDSGRERRARNLQVQTMCLMLPPSPPCLGPSQTPNSSYPALQPAELLRSSTAERMVHFK